MSARPNDPIRGTLTEEEFREYLNEFLTDAEREAAAASTPSPKGDTLEKGQ